MSETVSDFILERLSEWDITRIYGFPGDGINGLMGAMDRAEDSFPIHPREPRGNGRLHGLRTCEIYRGGRRLHGDLRARRYSSAQRPVRREDGSPTGGGDRRATAASGTRRIVSAGS